MVGLIQEVMLFVLLFLKVLVIFIVTNGQPQSFFLFLFFVRGALGKKRSDDNLTLAGSYIT